ncbi:hypothetical protein ATE84_1730 [Aquimarina sp. MAR_2010_214]|uniref:hypothetical protein n=1 Tax=Aquimarina sp. MAR_2010_214 TaxID=1250026 RepID=UPI000C710A5F|nr:hypothetical protein [Aquimarina sp. MAR_2010_214]PKV49695.1 hypothetical protein ATE84_1730 [Aquimarina sp. MAR_2010_214]
MGWTQQGYNAQGFNPSFGIKSNFWYVECNGDEDDEIEKFDELKVDINNWDEKLKIVYGTSGREYFRGYILTNDTKAAKFLLDKFHRFLVYEGKYGGEKEFDSNKLTLIPFLNIIIFFETNAKRYLIDETVPLAEIAEEIFKELMFAVKHGFISDLGKSREEISKEMKSKILLTQNKPY